MMLHEILDKENNQLIELQWDLGLVAKEIYEEVKAFAEIGEILPHK